VLGIEPSAGTSRKLLPRVVDECDRSLTVKAPSKLQPQHHAAVHR
jgi:hypothetical protein